MRPAPALTARFAEHLAAWETAEGPLDQASALDLFAREAAETGGGDRDAGDALLRLIRAAFDKGCMRPAIAAVREAAARDPNHEATHFLLCSLLLLRGDPEAGEVFRLCLARFPGPSPGWIEVGDALLAKGQKEAALLCLARGVPDAALAIQCGVLARDLARADEALSWFDRAVRLDRNSERGWFLLGTAALDGRDFDLAIRAYRTVLRLNPARVEAEVNLGMALQETGDLDGARQSYRRAVHAQPDTFGRIAQALPGSPKGELWLDIQALRRSLAG